MKFTKILKNIILENAKNKYLINLEKLTKPTKDKEGKKVKPIMSKEVFDVLVQGDPTTRLNNVDLSSANQNELENVKAGSYVIWLVKQYLKPKTERQPGDNGYEREFRQMQDLFIEDLYKVTDDLKKFERFKTRLPEGKRDINNISSPQELYDLVKDFSLEKTKATKDEKKVAAETYDYPGGQVDFRGNDWTVVKISDQGQLGKGAACFYGGNHLDVGKGETRWCTSSPGYNWFERYIKDGPLYVVIPNNWTGKRGESSGLPATRYQFHFPSNQFMDPSDHSVDLVSLLAGPMSELKDYFKPEFARGLTSSDSKKFSIDSFTHGATGKFIALYGLEDLLSNLPDSIEEFQIQNRDNNDLIINIPEDIGRFKNLNMIMLENCIEQIPDSICELPNLRFLALINNKKLKSIPDCINNLPKLLFLNLKGSPNVKVPQGIMDRALDLGNGMLDLHQG